MGSGSFPSAEQPRNVGRGPVWSRRGPWLCSPGPLQTLVCCRRPGKGHSVWCTASCLAPSGLSSPVGTGREMTSVFLADDFTNSLMFLFFPLKIPAPVVLTPGALGPYVNHSFFCRTAQPSYEESKLQGYGFHVGQPTF